MPYIFLVPSDQCPWKLLLQLQLFLLALRSSAVTAWFRMVLPRPEQQEWQVWLIPPSRQNLPCSKGWKISVSHLLRLPFVAALQPRRGSAPCQGWHNCTFSRKLCRCAPQCPHWECFSISLKWLLNLFMLLLLPCSSSCRAGTEVRGWAEG